MTTSVGLGSVKYQGGASLNPAAIDFYFVMVKGAAFVPLCLNADFLDIP